jgi:hypothetical protein
MGDFDLARTEAQRAWLWERIDRLTKRCRQLYRDASHCEDEGYRLLKREADAANDEAAKLFRKFPEVRFWPEPHPCPES